MPISRQIHFGQCLRLGFALLFLAVSSGQLCAESKLNPTANWIWIPVHKADAVPQGAAGFFRQTFELRTQSSAMLDVAADDSFEVTVNGRAVGRGEEWKYFTRYDISPMLIEGTNSIAIKVVNKRGATAGLAAQIRFKNGKSIVTDEDWKCSALASPKWQQARFEDSRWRQPLVIGAWGETEPWVVTPLPSARRVAAINSPTKPRRVEAALDGSKVVLAAHEEAPGFINAKIKPMLLKPMENFLNRRKRSPKALNNAVPLPPQKPAMIGIRRGTEREIVNPHVKPSDAAISAPSAPAIPQPQQVNPKVDTVPAAPKELTNRFTTRDGFKVEQIVAPKETGSLICATFNEFGQMLAAREDGPLLLISDSNQDKLLDEVRVFCDKVKNCQGILALSGMVFVVAEGPEGSGLYRLSDEDRNGELEEANLLAGFDVSSAEHGPHGIVLGPDGKLYVVVGNHAKIQGKFSPQSPQRYLYEGDLIPRYEDPGGHASGIRSPGGFVLRTDINGKKMELFASGLRNSYDLAFNSDGQLFTYDSDMESDSKTNWYRPTRLYHVVPGGEFGWRSGWGKWPAYYHDVIPPSAETGRGSPTGVVFYQHDAYPEEFRDAAFLGDWSEGRILTARLESEGASYSVKTQTFIEGTPLNVTDLEVGPDGMLYFVTGGRGTQGGIYRVAYQGLTPKQRATDDITKVLTAPQINSSWGRQTVAAIQQRLGTAWNDKIISAVNNATLPEKQRLQAIQLMQWIGPIPNADLLLKLSEDESVAIRRMATYLMSSNDDERLPLRQLELLSDPHPMVRRQACESLVRAHRSVPFEYVAPLLKSDDRYETWAARRLLALDEPSEWEVEALSTDDVPSFVQAATALVTAWPSKERSTAVALRSVQLMQNYVADDDFIDLLRTLQLAVLHGELTGADVPPLVAALSEEFPANNHLIMNRELTRLLVRLDASKIKERYLTYLESDIPSNEKIHLATHLCFLTTEWSTEEKLRLFKHLTPPPGAGNSVAGYLQNVSREFGKQLDPTEDQAVLIQGGSNPSAALEAVLRLPEKLTLAQVQNLIALDQSVTSEDATSKKLKVAIMAVLARDGRDSSMAYIRKIYDTEPKRRLEATIALAEQPAGENWDYLVRSLPLVEGDIAKDLLKRLESVDRTPSDSEPYRQVILVGSQLGDKGGEEAVRLLEHWRGFAHTEDTPPWNEALVAWKNWYSRTYPDSPIAESSTSDVASKWDYHKLLKHLDKPNVNETASAERGKHVFSKAKCASCHQHGDFGDSMGPNLTSVGKRFITKEIVDSIIYPSRVISDQYKAKTLVTDEGETITGIVGAGNTDELVVLKADGTKVRVPKESVEQTVPSKISAMPEGLLDSLTLEEVTDLMAYLRESPVEMVSENVKDTLDR